MICEKTSLPAYMCTSTRLVSTNKMEACCISPLFRGKSPTGTCKCVVGSDFRHPSTYIRGPPKNVGTLVCLSKPVSRLQLFLPKTLASRVIASYCMHLSPPGSSSHAYKDPSYGCLPGTARIWTRDDDSRKALSPQRSSLDCLRIAPPIWQAAPVALERTGFKALQLPSVYAFRAA